MFLTIVIIALALSLDAFAVAISCGIKLFSRQWTNYLKISSAFAFFQMLMPLLGLLLGKLLYHQLAPYASYTAFIIFFTLGCKNLRDCWKKDPQIQCNSCQCQGHRCLLGLSVATSIDALLIGIIFPLYDINLYAALPIIGIITFLMSLAGCLLGQKAVALFRSKMQIIASLLLFLLAIKSLI